MISSAETVSADAWRETCLKAYNTLGSAYGFNSPVGASTSGTSQPVGASTSGTSQAPP